MPRPMSSPYRTMEITLSNLVAFLEDLKQDADAAACVELMQAGVQDVNTRLFAAYYDSRPIAVIGILHDKYLRFVIVREPHRRKGVGRMLIEKYAQQVQAIMLPHAPVNSSSVMHTFFRHVGWKDYKQMDERTDSMIRGDFLA